MPISFNKAPREIVAGPTFDALTKAFDKIMTSGNVPSSKLAAGFSELKFLTKDIFNIDAEFTIPLYSEQKDYKFYGFRAFPKPLDLAYGYVNAHRWHIEIDHRLVVDYSHHLTPSEVAMLFIYYVENVMTDVTLDERIKYLHLSYMSPENLDWRVVQIYNRRNPSVYNLNLLLLIWRAYWVNFVEKLPETSIIYKYNDSYKTYTSAVNKIIKAYGTSELINRRLDEFDHGCLGIVKMIYESINDLKYSAHRFRKNFRLFIDATTSPYAKKTLEKLYHGFVDNVDMVFAQENSQFVGHRNATYKTQEMIAIENANIQAYWKNTFKTLLENVEVQFLDRNGMALKCSKLEVDELRVQVANIDSTEDKIFLLEKVHKNLGIIDNALMLLAQKDKKHKVRQSETELRALRADLEMIRERIFKAPIGPTHYGLFIKYPQGYEG